MCVFCVSWDDLIVIMYSSFQTELGDRLLPCFSSDSGIPYSDVNLFSGHAHAPKWGPDSSVAEVSSIQLEFRDLSCMTRNPKYQQAVDRTMEKLQSKVNGLVPQFVNAQTGLLRGTTYTLGSRTDSYYEYLLKQWLQSGKTEEKSVFIS